jgi:antitoxin MazE
MQAKLIAIGNSEGVRIPKSMIKDAKLGKQLELVVKDDTIVIKSFKRAVRPGWRDEAKRCAEEKNSDLEAWEVTTGDGD